MLHCPWSLSPAAYPDVAGFFLRRADDGEAELPYYGENSFNRRCCGHFAILQEISVCMRMRGGLGRTRT